MKIRVLTLTLLSLAFATPAVQAQKNKKNAAPRSAIMHEGWIDFNKNGRMDVYEDPARTIDERVEDLLSQMTLEEKTCQLATLYGFGRVLQDSLPTPRWKNEIWKDGIANIDEMLNGVEGAGRFKDYNYPFSRHVDALHTVQRFFVEDTRLGIPTEFTNEGIHGLNHTKATPLPAPISLGSTWDRDLIYRAGNIAGHEAKLLGYHSVYALILDLARDPRWGRTSEPAARTSVCARPSRSTATLPCVPPILQRRQTRPSACPNKGIVDVGRIFSASRVIFPCARAYI